MYTLPTHLLMEFPRVYPIADSAALAARDLPAVSFAEALLEAGARILQFRTKEQFTPAALEIARSLAALCARAGAQFVINDRADIARMLGAGVHVGQDDLAPNDARRVAGPALLGFSTHNREQLLAAAQETVDYLALGPVFGTSSKANPDPIVGLEGLRSLRPLSTKPLVAIGGITRDRAAAVIAAGADSIAVIGDLLPADTSKAAIRARMEEWQTAVRT
jgi:thiamine-phosphate pyrophosphorylase